MIQINTKILSAVASHASYHSKKIHQNSSTTFELYIHTHTVYYTRRLILLTDRRRQKRNLLG